MRIEDFKYVLIPLRDLHRLSGRERRRQIRALRRYSPVDYSRFRIWAEIVAFGGSAVIVVITGIRGENPFLPLLCVGLAGIGSALIGYVRARRQDDDSLIALSEELDARATRLPEGEFAEIAGMLACAPDSAQEDVQCGCYGCMKMLLPGEGRCAACGPRYAVYGDANHPLDEARLKRIHDLLLEGEDDV